MQEIRAWIDNTLAQFNNLPPESQSATFEQILIMIAPERVTKTRQLQGELRKNIDERTKLAEKNSDVAQEHFQDRVWNLVKMEKDCTKQLKSIDKRSRDLITR